MFSASGETPSDLDLDGSVSDIELKPNGSVAWISSRWSAGLVPPVSYRVYVADTAGHRRVATGDDIGPDSLAASGSWLFWRQGGSAQVAAFD